MSKRAPQFDMGQERPQEPRRSPPAAHRCSAPGCTDWAFYGFREPGIAALRKPVIRWVCHEHQSFGPGRSGK